MRIALTFNGITDAVHEIARTLASLGHVVTPVEVTRPVDAVIAELQRLAPELVFNLVDGAHEAFYPALFAHLGLPHTGSSASTLAMCNDKALAKRMVAAARVPTPGSALVRTHEDLGEIALLTMPVAVKPNLGDAPARVFSDVPAAQAAVIALLAQHPAGVLVEQEVAGVDVEVAWVDGHALSISGPPLDAITTHRLTVLAKRAFAALGISGYGKARFRIGEEGAIYFLEMNPLPLATDRDVLASIVGAAARCTWSARLTARH